MVEVCGRLGIDARASTRHGERLRRRGFRAVEEHALPCPLGPWARGQRQKRLGWMARKDLYEGIDGISRKLFVLQGDSVQDADAFIERCKEELLDPSVCRPPFFALPSISPTSLYLSLSFSFLLFPFYPLISERDR